MDCWWESATRCVWSTRRLVWSDASMECSVYSEGWKESAMKASRVSSSWALQSQLGAAGRLFSSCVSLSSLPWTCAAPTLWAVAMAVMSIWAYLMEFSSAQEGGGGGGERRKYMCLYTTPVNFNVSCINLSVPQIHGSITSTFYYLDLALSWMLVAAEMFVILCPVEMSGGMLEIQRERKECSRCFRQSWEINNWSSINRKQSEI